MSLKGKKVAYLVEDEYQELEVWYPLLRLKEAGAEVTTVGSGTKTTYESKLGYPVDADTSADKVKAGDFDAVVVPGGFAPDNMRLHPPMIDFVRDFDAAGKLVAAICHGGWVLCSAGVAKNRKMTGYGPIKDDVVNAGGTWLDQEVVRDGNVITSRTPPDLPAFAAAIVDYLENEG